MLALTSHYHSTSEKKTVGSAEHKIGRWGTASKVFCKCQIWVATVHVLNTLFLYLGKHSGSLA